MTRRGAVDEKSEAQGSMTPEAYGPVLAQIRRSDADRFAP